MTLASIDTLSTITLLHSLCSLTIAQLQAPQGEGSSQLMVVFMGIAAISLLVLTLIVVGTLVALLIIGLKARTAFAKTLQEVKGRAYPLIEKSTNLVSDLTPTIKSIAGKADALVSDLTPTIKGITEKTHSLLEDLSPKVSGITDDLHGITSRALEITQLGKEKLEEFSPAVTAARDTFLQANATVRSANDKTERQVERIDGMVTDVLDWTSQVPAKLEHTLEIPGRKLSEVATKVGTEVGSLMKKGRNLWRSLTKRDIRKVSVSTPVSSESHADAPTTPAPREDGFAIG